MYPEFVGIYICLCILILMVIAIIILLVKLIKDLNCKTVSTNAGYSRKTPKPLEKSTIVFCKKCATKFDSSHGICPKCGTPR